jgi:tripartite-type tricarboxylate transporter receptor subunit TctC
MAPGVPEDRVQAVRTAFAATLTDADFLAEAKRINLEITGPTFGKDLQDMISRIYDTPEDIVSGLQIALKN